MDEELIEFINDITIGVSPSPIVLDENTTIISIPSKKNAVWDIREHSLRGRWIQNIVRALGYVGPYIDGNYYILREDDDCYNESTYCSYEHKIPLSLLIRWTITDYNYVKIPERIVERERIEIEIQKGYICSFEKREVLSVSLSRELHSTNTLLKDAYLNNNHKEAQRLLNRISALREVMGDLNIEEQAEYNMFVLPPAHEGLWNVMR